IAQDHRPERNRGSFHRQSRALALKGNSFYRGKRAVTSNGQRAVTRAAAGRREVDVNGAGLARVETPDTVVALVEVTAGRDSRNIRRTNGAERDYPGIRVGGAHRSDAIAQSAG